jgi:hypothetical protein
MPIQIRHKPSIATILGSGTLIRNDCITIRPACADSAMGIFTPSPLIGSAWLSVLKQNTPTKKTVELTIFMA